MILTEVDFPEFNENVFRRLFVGATSATVKLIIVASARAAGESIAGLRYAPRAFPLRRSLSQVPG